MGRPRRFDEERLLDAAQERFWTQGYDRTAIDEIAADSGVGNGSIYAAYGSKAGLFLVAFRRYCDARVRLVESVVASHEGGFEEAVAHYLAEIVAECTGWPDRRGCLMLNSIAELGARLPEVQGVAKDAVDRMEAVLTARVRRGVEDHEIVIAPDRIRSLGAHILLVSQGLIHLSRIGMPAAHLRDVADVSSRMSSLYAAA